MLAVVAANSVCLAHRYVVTYCVATLSILGLLPELCSVSKMKPLSDRKLKRDCRYATASVSCTRKLAAVVLDSSNAACVSL